MNKILFTLFASILVLIGCNKETTNNRTAENTVNTHTIKTVTFDELFSNKFEPTKSKVAVEGLCVHVCKHSGKKIFIINTDPNNKFQIFAGEGLSGFPQDIEGSKVRVVGTLEEEKLDMKYVDNLEVELKADGKSKQKESKGSCVVEDEMKKISDLRTKISNSPKGYFSIYSMTATEYKKL